MGAGRERGGAEGSAPWAGGVRGLRAGGGAGGARGDLSLHPSALGLQEQGETCPSIPEPSSAVLASPPRKGRVPAPVMSAGLWEPHVSRPQLPHLLWPRL